MLVYQKLNQPNASKGCVYIFGLTETQVLLLLLFFRVRCLPLLNKHFT